MTQQSTHHPLAESISALVDNQASELELQRILKSSESDPEVKAIWSRYQVASASMRRDLPNIEISDFASRISAAIDEEDAHSIASVVPEKTIEKRASGWMQNVARFAVAASVAGGVIFFAQQYDGGQDLNAPVVAAAATEAPLPAASLPVGYNAQPLTARAVGLQSGYESRQQDNRQVVFDSFFLHTQFDPDFLVAFARCHAAQNILFPFGQVVDQRPLRRFLGLHDP